MPNNFTALWGFNVVVVNKMLCPQKYVLHWQRYEKDLTFGWICYKKFTEVCKRLYVGKIVRCGGGAIVCSPLLALCSRVNTAYGHTQSCSFLKKLAYQWINERLLSGDRCFLLNSKRLRLCGLCGWENISIFAFSASNWNFCFLVAISQNMAYLIVCQSKDVWLFVVYTTKTGQKPLSLIMNNLQKFREIMVV